MKGIQRNEGMNRIATTEQPHRDRKTPIMQPQNNHLAITKQQ